MRPPNDRRRRLALAATAVALIVATTMTAAAADTSDDLDQTVDSDEALEQGQVAVEAGHFDIGPRLPDGTWRIQIRDDSQAPPVWRDPQDVVFHLLDDAILPAPADEQFEFIDAEPESDVYVVPQTQLTEVVWVGWNSQDPEVVSRLSGGMTLRFHGVQGPGQFTLFMQNGNFDPAQLLWTSDDPEPQDIWADANTHVHGNWVFTEPGAYLMDVEVLAELADGTSVSDRSLLRFAVGTDTEPEAVFGAQWDGAADADSTSSTATTDPDAPDPTSAGTTEADTDDGGSGPPIAVIAGAGALLVVAALVIAGALRSRRARRLAESESE
ncbi:choice-of-anchor M domain-containing protein [Occultella gossypii]|uniref:Choice-of-anchor M domain-containing protein n=1 Tax=Occultella gossypii TaxID=2800820 RepID=A0ABS7SD75_9MICO|nr:choice-of-anchor M domain-containing protein [Occultella gossypii]MBZ2198304.1 choice-of-anchor M domain-containing protein [Occultella gossypii]